MIHEFKLTKIFEIILLILFPIAIGSLFLSKNNSAVLGAIILAVLCLGYFFAFVLNKPEFGILSLLFSMAFMVNYSNDMGISYHIIYAIVPLGCLLYLVKNFPRSKIFLFLLFWIFLYYSAVIIVNPYEKPIIGWVLRMNFLISAFIWSLLVKWNREKIFFIVITYGSYLIVWGILEKIIYNVQRVSGPTGFATNYAILLAILWTICFVDFCVKRKQAVFLIFCTLCVLFCIFLSGTRLGLVGMFLGALIGLGVWIFVKKDMSVLYKVTMIISVLLIFVGIIYFIWLILPNDIYIVKNVNILLSGKIDSSTLGRLAAWNAAWDTFLNNMIWGNGPDTFSDIYVAFINKLPPMPLPQKMPVAHNEILNILSENGLAGFTQVSVIIVICLFCIINYIRRKKDDSIAIALLSAFFVLFSLMMFDASPSRGFDSWLLGVLASFGISHGNEHLS